MIKQQSTIIVYHNIRKIFSQEMEGVLWKWTNYWNGWQPRWFVLDNGILAYYKSQEEVNQGCKGSVRLSACEIAVHQTDQKRLDLVIPSEQHFYLRASSPQERQQWLVALGSAKAALSSQQKSPAGKAGPDNLKMKKSELRLYCDLLMQQVHTITSSVQEQDVAPDVEKMKEAAELLSATCDTFIKTLEDCMKISNASFTYELPHQHVKDSALPSETAAIPVGPPVVPTSLQSAKKSHAVWTIISTEKLIIL
ncbi:pleckstrin homology domain-containing family A member 3-like isoform X3 [Tachypleus tridentatus]|uniref:pleckstrin homology domain-containing family A member 3-like isoform X3 n=1 Tax=Tachypleus tridentatus TaxID=6853 RepID=UPI003FD68E2F